jgi:hypothetical protein
MSIMASVEADFAAIDDNLARSQAGSAQRDEQRDLEHAGPVVPAEVQAGLEAAATAKAEADDAELEI